MFDTLVLLRQYIRVRHLLRFKSRVELVAYQDRMLAKFFSKTLHKSTFYSAFKQRAFKHRALDDFPIMNKAKMLENFDALNSASLSLQDAMAEAEQGEKSRNFKPTINGVSVGLSTGTSGTRGVFLVSDRERMGWAGTILGRMLPGSILAKHRIAFFLRANNNLYESVASKGRIEFQFFDLMSSIPQLLADLHTYKPTILIAPAQVLGILAQAQIRGDIEISPDKIISVAEVLYDDDAAQISNAFGKPVSQVYQCTEGFLGYSCTHNRLHLNEALMIIEPDWLDEQKERFCPIITDFSRETQLFIRHRLDDILTRDPNPCPCGSPEMVIKRIEGRTDDVLVLRDLAGVPQTLMPDYVTRAIAACPSVLDFKIEQNTDDELVVFLLASDKQLAKAETIQTLAKLFERHNLRSPTLTIEEQPSNDPTQKRRRVVRAKNIGLPQNEFKQKGQRK